MYTISQIAHIVAGRLVAGRDEHSVIHDLLYDSRKITGSAHALFFAVKTAKNDGHKYIRTAYEKGVINFVVMEHFESEMHNYPHANFIVAADTLQALQQLAAYHRRQYNIPVVGITGSNGKTTVKEWLYQLLCEDKKVVYSPNSFNSQIGVPLSVWKMKADDELGIFEAGISQPSEMERLKNIISPTIGVFTNIGTAHDEGFMGESQKVGEKLLLFQNAETLVYCADHSAITEVLVRTEIAKKVRIFRWSTRKQDADMYVQSVHKNDKHTLITAIYEQKQLQISIPFVDDASVENVIHCWAVMLLLGYDNAVIAERVTKLASIAMRLEMKQGINRCLIINDTYNSDINSLQIAIDLMNNQRQFSRRTVILSDILQSGSSEKDLYKDIANLLETRHVNKIVGIGDAICRQADSFGMEKEFYRTTDDFFAEFEPDKLENEVVLVKGARKYGFERISKYLELKTHETVLEVNLNNLIANMNYYRSLVPPATKVMAMVKAFSYGAGDIDVANALQYHGADYFTVAYADEGVTLRKKNIKVPIMVMNPEERAMDLIFRYNLQPEIYSFKVLRMICEALKLSRHESVHVHIKIDTGMHRLGFMPEDLPQVAAILKATPQIVVESVFSHFAAADDAAEDAFTHTQAAVLTRSHAYLTGQLGYRPMKHICNTCGICRFPEYHFDMVRMGIGLYGVSPLQDGVPMNNVSTLKTVISQLRDVPQGETVGYNRTFKADKPTRIATLPIGYADGFPRSAGYGRTQVYIHGHLAPIVGSVCMDMCMADVTGLPVKEEDEVIIFGKERPIGYLAQASGLIEYELLTGISQRVKRVYIED